MQVGMDFGWLLDRFLVDLGPKLGAKLGPSWHQNRKKSDAKTMSKKHTKSRGPSQLEKARAEGGGVPINNSNHLPEQLRWTLDTHFVPLPFLQGHGGGYIYIYIYMFIYHHGGFVFSTLFY